MIRRKISNFAEQMAVELEHNKRKGSVLKWKGLKDKFIEIEYHKAKLLLAIKEKNRRAIKEYIADIGNILLSIGDEFRLYDKKTTDDGLAVEMKTGLFNTVKIDEQVTKNKNL